MFVNIPTNNNIMNYSIVQILFEHSEVISHYSIVK